MSISRPVEIRLQVFASLVVVGMLLPVIGCKGRSKEIALLTPTTGVITWDAVHTGAVRQIGGCGMTVRYNGPPRDDDLRTQLVLFQRATEDRYAAIVVSPIQMDAFRDPIERVSEKGTPIIVIGGDLGIRNPNVTYVMTDERQGGKLAADKVAEVLHHKGRIAIMGLDFRKSSSLERERGFEQELALISSELRVVQRRNGTSNLYQEQQTADDLLGGVPAVDAIVSLTAAATRGAFYAVKARRMQPNVHIVGFDQDLLLPVLDKQIDAVIGIKANDMGRLVGQLVCDHHRGQNWNGSYVLQPALLTAETLGSADLEQQKHGGGWWLGER